MHRAFPCLSPLSFLSPVGERSPGFGYVQTLRVRVNFNLHQIKQWPKRLEEARWVSVPQFVRVFGTYVRFSSRANRSELWFWMLFYVLVLIADSVVDSLLGLSLIGGIASLVLFLPTISVQVRRLHDRDRSGWWWFIFFVPLVGSIVMFIWFVLKGTRGDNRFGPDPLDKSGTLSALGMQA